MQYHECCGHLCIYNFDQCSPAPEHVVTKKQHNDDLLKELFPDSSDEENEVPSTSTSSVNSNNNDCNSSLMASLVCVCMHTFVSVCKLSPHMISQVGNKESHSHYIILSKEEERGTVRNHDYHQ